MIPEMWGDQKGKNIEGIGALGAQKSGGKKMNREKKIKKTDTHHPLFARRKQRKVKRKEKGEGQPKKKGTWVGTTNVRRFNRGQEGMLRTFCSQPRHEKIQKRGKRKKEWKNPQRYKESPEKISLCDKELTGRQSSEEKGSWMGQKSSKGPEMQRAKKQDSVGGNKMKTNVDDFATRPPKGGWRTRGKKKPTRHACPKKRKM